MAHVFLSLIIGTVITALFTFLYTKTCNRIIEQNVLNNKNSPSDADRAFMIVDRANKLMTFVIPFIAVICFTISMFLTKSMFY